MSRFLPGARSARVFNLNIPQCAAKVQYSNATGPFFNEKPKIDRETHPLHAMLTDRLAGMPRDALRWNISTNPSQKVLPKTVLRSALGRRWKIALVQALQEKGYTREGRQKDTGKPGIVGTLELSIFGGAGMQTPLRNLIRQCKAVIKAIEARQPMRQSHRDEGLQRSRFTSRLRTV